ncbi:unnamed protein product [Didymodactylos carnosus]|uniref:Uncharacterized protein n=1 Tax=Didymodactylos carnosus TaxID=1234261 RepID=A0A815GCX8_9BILA|nr:unnamed protein product [Didymodactylos carnosus]CAF4194745.1 unnamed protein product [Didymodactylos carnosus]
MLATQRKRIMTPLDIESAQDVMILNKNEDITIIWHDDNLEVEIREQIECLHGTIFTSDITIISQKSIIDSFYIFCIYKELYQDLLGDKRYSKLCGIYDEYGQLFDQLRKHIHSIIKHLSIFKLFNQTGKPIRDLEQEIPEYLYYQLLRDKLMLVSTETNKAKQDMINYCCWYYHGDKIILNRIDEFEKTYQSTDAIQWYTKDSFLFRFVNKALRTEDLDTLHYLRYFIIDLCKQLKWLFDKNRKSYQERHIDTITVWVILSRAY